MEDKKVAVIMSTYNGEKFIREQIDSILNQTYKNLVLVIRDDGSKDGTVEIIKEYQSKYPNIEFHAGENLGFVKSFFELLKYRDDVDYYAYADQDDVWIENKIAMAVSSLNGLDQTKPNMAFCNSDYYDENMKFLAKGQRVKEISFLRSLFSCCSQGMTMTVNKTTRDMIIENTPKECFFHDWWTYILCAGLGNVIHNDAVGVKYRRRKDNATSEGQGYFNLLKWRIKNFVVGKGMSDIKRQILNFREFYYYNLSKENRKIMQTFGNEVYSLSRAFEKAFYKAKLRDNAFDDLLLRIIFLMGVL